MQRKVLTTFVLYSNIASKTLLNLSIYMKERYLTRNMQSINSSLLQTTLASVDHKCKVQCTLYLVCT